jgi:hypothetical protein
MDWAFRSSNGVFPGKLTRLALLVALAATTHLASCAANRSADGSSTEGSSQSQSELALKQLDSDPTAASEPWLVELNRLRATGGLKPVSANAQLSADCVAHAKYLVEQGPASPAEFANYVQSLGENAHSEDPKSPHYSAPGAECAQGGKHLPGLAWSNDVAFTPTPIEDIDGLFYAAPFHRFSMLVTWATVAGYGSYGEYPRRRIEPPRTGRNRLADDPFSHRRQYGADRTR